MGLEGRSRRNPVVWILPFGAAFGVWMAWPDFHQGEAVSNMADLTSFGHADGDIYYYHIGPQGHISDCKVASKTKEKIEFLDGSFITHIKLKDKEKFFKYGKFMKDSRRDTIDAKDLPVSPSCGMRG